jgi:trk system potassium uptake protein TrkA
VVDSILSNLTGKGIRGIHHLGEGSLEILEAEIANDSPAAEKAITDFKLSEGSLIILVNRCGSSFIPKGEYIFKAEDKVSFLTKIGSEAKMEKIFGPR